MLLSVKNLATHFHAGPGKIARAVDGISFDLEQGKTLALVGESGCGKTQTAFSIIRLVAENGYHPTGEIQFQGQDLFQLEPEEMRNLRGNDIAMIFQEPMTSLNPVFTIGRQLTETLLRHTDKSQAEANERALELLGQVGISDPVRRLTQFPHHLSGGMRQRVMIAMALACNPKLIIADEPTTALDVTIQAQILELMKGLSERLGVAQLIITHNLGVVARYAQRVNVMYAGKIVEMGTAKEIYHNPRHPYTLGLLASVPRLDQQRGTQLVPIEGQPPDLARLDDGCAFRPRCRYATERCAHEIPELQTVEGDHVSACWHFESLGQQSQARQEDPVA